MLEMDPFEGNSDSFFHNPDVVNYICILAVVSK